MNKILVTGGAGFIGSHLIPSLIGQGFSVRVLDSLESQIHGVLPNDLDWLLDDRIEFVRGSVTSRSDLEKSIDGVNYIIHLAAETGTGQSMYEIARYNNVNSQGTALLFDVLANNSSNDVKRVVLASSRSVYGEGAYVCHSSNSDERVFPSARPASQLENAIWDPLCENCDESLKPVPTREDSPVSPASIYAATKYAQEDIVRIGCDSLGIDYAILRFQNVYGERQSLNNPYTGILSIFSTRARRGMPLTLFEDGLESRDFVHVEDVSAAIFNSISSKNLIKQVINVGSGTPTTVQDVAYKLSNALNTKENIIITGEYRLGDIRHNYADISRMEAVLSYTPKITIDEGLQRFANWVLEQPLPEDLLEKANNELRSRKLMG